MGTTRFSELIERFTASGDLQLRRVAHDARYLVEDHTPQPAAIEELADEVTRFFPTPFANTFEAWQRHVRADFLRSGSASDELVKLRFENSFHGVWTCWRQIVHFMPFVLLAPLSLLSDELQRRAGARLSNAFIEYHNYYRVPRNVKQEERAKFEGQQRDLLNGLIELCADLGSAKPWPSPFFFGALVDDAHPFRALFPVRYALELKFLQAIRNAIEHRNLGRRAPPVLHNVHELSELAFLDAVAIMVPIARAYGLYYVEKIDDVATVSSFSGTRPSPAHFAVASGGPGTISSAAFLPKHVYLIDRRFELEHDLSAPPLEPDAYADLTPFIIERARLQPLRRSVEDRRIYALDEYSTADPRRFVQFEDLAGDEVARLPEKAEATDYERRELSDLLGDIERISAIAENLDSRAKIRRRSGSLFGALRRTLWNVVSKRELDTIVDVQAVDFDGSPLAPSAGAALCSYDPELYVAPKEAEQVDAFAASGKAGLLLIGGSGLGKTTLMASCFLALLRTGEVAVFLSGRRISKGSLREIFADIAAIADEGWTLADLDDFLETENAGRKLQKEPRPPVGVTIFVDAVNEYTGGIGALGLVRELIEFVNTRGRSMFSRELKHVRLVASCRSETWLGYWESGAQGLDPDAFFCAPGGEPLTVEGFADEAARRRLYESYRARYGLVDSPYDSLTSAVHELFQSPLMLAIVADTFGTLDRTARGRKIPRDLKQHHVFARLREKKAENCRDLVPSEARKKSIADEVDACLTTFATLLYERLTAPEDPRDYVGVEQTARQPMTQYSGEREDGQITPFRALREVGLITSKGVSETDRYGIERNGRAYTFFHDRYAEYELARVYQDSVLGRLSSEVNRDPAALQRIGRSFEELVKKGAAFPVLAGALDHWLQMNLAKGDPGPLMPLCDRLSGSRLGSVRSKVSDALTAFAATGTLRPKEFYRKALAACKPALRIDLATALGNAWPGVSVDVVRDFVEACSMPRDELVVETLANAFAEHANARHADADGTSAVAFVAQVVPDVRGLLAAAPDLNRLRADLKFLAGFSLMTIVMCAERPSIVGELRDLLVDRFRWLIGFVVGKQTGNVFLDWPAARLRDFLREMLERLLYGAWEDGVSCGGVNDTFFVLDHGLVQREVLFHYVPFMCAVHERDFARLSLEDGSPFLELSLRMLNFRKYSVLGFAAYAAVTIAIGEDHAALRRIATKLMREGSEAGRFVAINLVEAYSIVHPEFAHEALAIAAEEMLVPLLDDPEGLAHLIFCAAGAVESNLDDTWDDLLPILDAAFEHFTDVEDVRRMTFATELRCMTFFGESRIGTRFVEYLISAGYLEEYSPWRPAALAICAGMTAGHRADLAATFAKHGIPDAVLAEADALRDQSVLEQQRTFGARARWNIFFVRMLAYNTKLRYLILKDMICPMALCNSVEECATQMGTFMIEAIGAYATDDDDPERYARLSVEDVYAATPFRPRPGQGRRYESRRRPSVA